MRAALATLVVLFAAGPASAEVKRRVLVESDPPGADVYLNSKDDGSLCKTPCTIDAPIGDTPIIVELANHLPLLENLSIPRRGKTATARFKLLPAVGTIIVTGPKGANIRIADIDRGTAPARIDIEAGPYMVVLAMNGKQIDSQPVEVAAGEEITVTGAGKVATVDPPVEDPPVEGPPTGGGVIKRGATKPRSGGPLFALSAAFDVGFRSFEYEDVAMTSQDKLRTESEGGQVIGGGILELWPGNLAGVRPLRGLSLIVRAQFPINQQSVTGKDLMGNPSTFWRSFEASVRQRWTVGGTGSIEIGAGYARDQYQFNTTYKPDLDLVPDVIYDAVKLGVGASIRFGSLEPFVGAGYRLVLGGGAMEARFPSGASATGLHGAAGIKAKLGPLDARLEGSITRYAWTFTADPTTDPFVASGAVDSIKLVSLALGYAY